MSNGYPEDLASLLSASGAEAQERTWARFVQDRSRLLLHTARSVTRDQDATMDAYAYILEALRADNFRRLREYVPRPHAQFETWLVLVARRLCIDRSRKLHGRAPAPDEPDSVLDRESRRRLAELAAEDVDVDTVAGATTDDPEQHVRLMELRQRLESALSTLEARDRLLLTYRYVDRLSAQEIAAVQKWPSHLHVYRRLTHVCELLRRELVRRGVESSVP